MCAYLALRFQTDTLWLGLALSWASRWGARVPTARLQVLHSGEVPPNVVVQKVHRMTLRARLLAFVLRQVACTTEQPRLPTWQGMCNKMGLREPSFGVQ